jgi:hypothetical protein
MDSLLRFKVGLLLCLGIALCLAAAISTGMQSMRGDPLLVGLRAPDQPGQPTVPKPAAQSPPTPTPQQAAQPQPPPAGCPIRWTPAVTLGDLSELAQPEPLLNRPLNLPRRTDKLTMVDARGHEAVAKTCGDYLRLLQQGCRSKTAYDAALEPFAKAQVYPLLYLRRAAPARQSFVGEFNVAADAASLLADLPPTLRPVLSGDDAQRVNRLIARGATWKTIFPSARVTVLGKHDLQVADRSSEVRLGVLAWADFNRDGLEDVLMSVSATARDGTFRSYGFAVLTRTARTAPLTLVEYRQ